MEMNSLHPEGHTEPAEPGPSRQRPSYKHDRVWRDIAAETGFASCADYMEFYKDIRPDFRALLRRYRAMPKDLDDMNGSAAEISIFDLSKQEDHTKCLRFREICYSGTQLLRTLCDPPGSACVQIIFWSQSLPMFSQELADAVILGLKLDPQLLGDLNNLWEGRDDYRTKGFRTSHIERLVGHGTIAILSRNFMIKSAKAVPVLLVAAISRDYGVRADTSAMAFIGGGRRKPPFSRSARYKQNLSGAQSYAEAVEGFIAQSRFTISTEAVLLLAAFSPLVHNEAYRVQEASIDVQDTYDDFMSRKLDPPSLPGMEHKNIVGDLDIQRLVLRHTLEKGENHVRQIFRYLCSDIDVDWSKEPSYVSIEADWKSLIEEARRLETEVRDYMQIQVGKLSLEESRRSIELSNIQIGESRSGQLYSDNLQTHADIL